MKKYYYVRLYQSTEWVGYLQEKTIINEIVDSFTNIPEVESYEFDEIGTIIVEKITPFQVKEIKTGIVFPIVNITIRSSYVKPLYYIEKPMYEAHTFILSKGDKILGKEIETTSEIEKYNLKHPDIKEYKNQLSNIINTGKQNMINKKQTLKTKKLKK